MKTLKSESVIFVDVDQTLIIWGKIKKDKKSVAITSPYSGEQHLVMIHTAHVKILKDRKARGSTIIVWSANGHAWAEVVVKALKLEEYVDIAMSKPYAYMDDKKAKEIMGERIYLAFDDSYGQ